MQYAHAAHPAWALTANKLPEPKSDGSVSLDNVVFMDVGRNLYISGGKEWGAPGGLAVSAGVGFAFGSGLALLSATAQVAVGVGATAIQGAEVTAKYIATKDMNLPPEMKRELQADAALTVVSAVATTVGAVRQAAAAGGGIRANAARGKAFAGRCRDGSQGPDGRPRGHARDSRRCTDKDGHRRYARSKRAVRRAQVVSYCPADP